MMRDVLAYPHVYDPSLSLVENSTLLDGVSDSITKRKCLTGGLNVQA